MIKISLDDLVWVLKKNIYDYCMLIPNLSSSEQFTKIECYISENKNTDFLCYLLYPDGSETLDIHWEQQDTIELIDLISAMKKRGAFSNPCGVCLYKNDALFQSIAKTCDTENYEYITSYFFDGDCYETDDISAEVVFGINNIILEDSFANQPGNHICTIIQRQILADPANNEILFLKVSDKIVGYIALTKQYENIWDVAYIFVDENWRYKGYGTFLCSKAKKLLRQQKRVLFYSYCENIGSEMIAQKSGLKPCAERFVFHTMFKGLGE